MTHVLRYAARTDRGLLRANNQDSVFAGDRLLVIADGMGGHAAGDVASRLVVAAFVDLDELPLGSDMVHPLTDATRHGNAAIAEMVEQNPEFDGMGTTLTALLFDGPVVALAHVGDSRAYLYRNGVLHQISHDDTFVQSLVDDGRITADEAAHHPQRSLLLRALNGTEMDPSITLREISPGDRFLICSDGLSDVVSPESIADALSGPEPDGVADTLIQLALVGGGPDNVTVIVADVTETGGPASYGGPAGGLDPEATGPIQAIHLTQKMPRVPLPPIPEEAAAKPEYAPADDDLDAQPDSEGRYGDDEFGDDAELPDARFDDPDMADPDMTEAERAGAAAGSQSAGRGGNGGRTSGAPRRRWHRYAAFALALLVLVGVALSGSYLWASTKYYVGEDSRQVAVFKGVNGSLLGWRFASVEENSCGPTPASCTPLKVDDLVQAARDQVSAGIPVSTLADARDVMNRLTSQQLPPCSTTDGSVSAVPATAVRSGSSSSPASSVQTGRSRLASSTVNAPPIDPAGSPTTGARTTRATATAGRTARATATARATSTARVTSTGGTPIPVTTRVTVTVNPFEPRVTSATSAGQRLRAPGPFGAVAPGSTRSAPARSTTPPKSTAGRTTAGRTTAGRATAGRTTAGRATTATTVVRPTPAKSTPIPTTRRSLPPVKSSTSGKPAPTVSIPTVTILTTVTSASPQISSSASSGTPLVSPAAQPGVTCRPVS